MNRRPEHLYSTYDGQGTRRVPPPPGLVRAEGD